MTGESGASVPEQCNYVVRYEPLPTGGWRVDLCPLSPGHEGDHEAPQTAPSEPTS